MVAIALHIVLLVTAPANSDTDEDAPHTDRHEHHPAPAVSAAPGKQEEQRMANLSRDPNAIETEQMLEELELRLHTEVATLRAMSPRQRHERIEIHAGNACDRDGMITELQTSELSTVSTTGLSPRPVMVGSVFQLRFDRHVVSAGRTLALCERCTMFGDASFEIRFRFSAPIELSDD